MGKPKVTKAQRQKIERHVKGLNDIRQELEDKYPDAYINWYLEDSSNLNLMSDESHDERGKPQQDAVMCSSCLDYSSGGGW